MTTQNRELASLIDNSGNVTATGNLTVSGTTTTISSTVQTIADPLIELNTGASSNSNDLGFVFERGSTGDNACLIWDESADVFVVGTTTATGTSTGNMSFTAAGLTAGAGVFSSLDISGDIDVDGTTNLDVVDIDGAVDMASTLGVSGVVTANAGVVVDNITIDGTEIDLSSGDLTLDVAGDIILDADGADIKFADAGTTVLEIKHESSSVDLLLNTTNDDFKIKGSDDGSSITALTLDMSEAGHAFFNGGISTGTTTANKVVNFVDPAQGGEQLKLHFEANNSDDNWEIYSYDRTNSHYANMSLGEKAIEIAGSNKDVNIKSSARITQVALTSSSNAVAWNAKAAANAFHLTTENTTFSAPSNAVEGAIISVEIAQGGTARTIAWNTVFEFAASTAPTVTATANKTDIFTFRYNGSVWQEIGRVQNMAQT